VNATRLPKTDKVLGKTLDGGPNALQPDIKTVGHWTVEADPTFDQPIAV